MLVGPKQERDLAWQTQVSIAICAPFAPTVAASPQDDQDSLIGESVYDSEAVHAALTTLAYGLHPTRPAAVSTVAALSAVSSLLVLRPSWITYCNDTFALAQDADDSRSEMSRQWVSANLVRAWPRFAEGQAAYGRATASIAQLQAELAEFCGRDVTASALLVA
ncbi:hypothetical protein [Streptomyces xanthochromogenes]|uniref:hypothetical protein n=1 Tax=Streptomyces xanthochromogenes TaxID=67384 RepID=UPI002F3E6373